MVEFNDTNGNTNGFSTNGTNYHTIRMGLVPLGQMAMPTDPAPMVPMAIQTGPMGHTSSQEITVAHSSLLPSAEWLAASQEEFTLLQSYGTFSSTDETGEFGPRKIDSISMDGTRPPKEPGQSTRNTGTSSMNLPISRDWIHPCSPCLGAKLNGWIRSRE